MKLIYEQVTNLIVKINQKYQQFTKGLSVNVYAAAIAYFLTIILLPLREMVNKVLEILNIKVDNLYQPNLLIDLIYFVSLIWVTSKLLNIMVQIVNQIFDTYQKKLIIRIFAFFKMFFLLFIVVVTIFIMAVIDEVITYLINQKIAFFEDVLGVFFIEFFLSYGFSTIIFYALYRLIIPLKIKHRDLAFVSIVMVIVSKILLILFNVQLFKDNLSFYYLKSFFILYFLSYLFVLSLLYLKKQNLPSLFND